MYRVITIAKYFQRDKSYSIEVGFKSAFKKKNDKMEMFYKGTFKMQCENMK